MGILIGSHGQNSWNSALFIAAHLAFVLLFFILWFRDRKILDFFKVRLTYPRTGYARPPDNPAPGQDPLVDFWTPDKRSVEILSLCASPHPRDENVTAFKARVIFTFFSAFIIAQVLNDTGWARWGIAVLMAAVAGAIFILNRGQVRTYSLGAVSVIALAGMLSTMVELPGRGRMFIPWVIGGAWLLAHGGWRLNRYLRSHPRPDRPEDAGE